MYGWRGRMGILLPYDNIVLEPEYARMMPEGLSAHVVRSLLTDRAAWAEDLGRMASCLSYLRADMGLYACSASSYMNGARWHDDFRKRLEEAAGVPIETANSAMIKALRFMGIRKVAIASPHPDWLIPLLNKFIEEYGIEVVSIRGLGLEPMDINPLEPEVAYRLAKDVMVPEADGVFIVSTNFRCMEVLDLLERELQKPVMGVNQAMLWAAMQRMGVRESITGWGSLLTKCAPRPEAG